jgi:hypothetical protein
MLGERREQGVRCVVVVVVVVVLLILLLGLVVGLVLLLVGIVLLLLLMLLLLLLLLLQLFLLLLLHYYYYYHACLPLACNNSVVSRYFSYLLPIYTSHRVGSKCFWDSNTDNQATANFTNVSKGREDSYECVMCYL